MYPLLTTIYQVGYNPTYDCNELLQFGNLDKFLTIIENKFGISYTIFTTY